MIVKLPPGNYDFTVDQAYLIEEVGDLIDKLAKPIMVYRFALAGIERPGAQKRLLNATKEIDRIANSWKKL